MFIDWDPIVLLVAKVVAIADSPKSSEHRHKSAHNYHTTTQKAHKSLAHSIVAATIDQSASNVKAESLLWPTIMVLSALFQ